MAQCRVFYLMTARQVAATDEVGFIKVGSVKGAKWGEGVAVVGRWGEEVAVVGRWGEEVAVVGRWGEEVAVVGRWGEEVAVVGRWGEEVAVVGSGVHMRVCSGGRLGRLFRCCGRFGWGGSLEGLCGLQYMCGEFCEYGGEKCAGEC